MKIQNNENVSFKGIVKFTKQADAENPVIRPLVNYLKHHCGGKSVEHELYMNKMNVRVHSKYIPKWKLNGFDRHDNLVVVGGNQGHVEIVNELLVKLKNTTEWAKNLKKADTAQEKAILARKNKSFLQKLFPFFTK